MSRVKFKAWLVALISLPVCLVAFVLAFPIFVTDSQWRENARAAVWANNMTASVLCNEHQWDSVRIIALSKDGHYIEVYGFVDSEDSLRELHSKLENPPPYIGLVPVYINWGVQVETNGLHSPSS
jgi:hypothetical protein